MVQHDGLQNLATRVQIIAPEMLHPDLISFHRLSYFFSIFSPYAVLVSGLLWEDCQTETQITN